MMANAQLNLGMRCIKYLLCTVNLLFVLTGVMVISAGMTIFAVYKDFSNFLQPSYVSPATILIIVGALIFIISFFGCCGALKESTCMVLVFAVSLTLVLMLELIAALTAYALQGDIKDSLENNLLHLMRQYNVNEDARSAVDYLQEHLQCCGFYRAQDWIMNGMNYPDSCSIDSTSHTSDGCYGKLIMIVNRSTLYVGMVAFTITLLQMTGIMFAIVLGRAIRRQKTERERRRWELRENLINGYQRVNKSDPVGSFPVVFTSPPIVSTTSSVIS